MVTFQGSTVIIKIPVVAGSVVAVCVAMHSGQVVAVVVVTAEVPGVRLVLSV